MSLAFWRQFPRLQYLHLAPYCFRTLYSITPVPSDHPAPFGSHSRCAPSLRASGLNSHAADSCIQTSLHPCWPLRTIPVVSAPAPGALRASGLKFYPTLSAQVPHHSSTPPLSVFNQVDLQAASICCCLPGSTAPGTIGTVRLGSAGPLQAPPKQAVGKKIYSVLWTYLCR